MKKIVVLLSLCLGLVGCDQDKQESYYFQHPNVLSKNIMQCQREGGDECPRFYAYGANFSQLIEAFRENQQLFGLTILHAQMQEDDVKRSLEKARKSQHGEAIRALEAQLQAQSMEIAKLLAVVNLFIRV